MSVIPLWTQCTASADAVHRNPGCSALRPIQLFSLQFHYEISTLGHFSQMNKHALAGLTET